MNFNASVQYEFARTTCWMSAIRVRPASAWWSGGRPTPSRSITSRATRRSRTPCARPRRITGRFRSSETSASGRTSATRPITRGTVKLEKRYSEGLFFSTFYTFSKAINSQDDDNDGTGVAPIQNRGLEKARAGYDRTHRLIGTVELRAAVRARQEVGDLRMEEVCLRRLGAVLDPDVGERQPSDLHVREQPVQLLPGFRRNQQRPDVVSQMEIRDGWDDLGGDRFNKGNSYSVFTGDNNGLSHFALPGGLPHDNPGGLRPHASAISASATPGAIS